MAKAVVKLPLKNLGKHEMALQNAKKVLGDGCVCCVMITCSEAAKDGTMQVEMHFDGDETLAAFLLESATQIFDDRFLEKESKNSQ